MAYSASQLYQSAIGAGFTPSSATTIVSIALSRGGAFPINGTGITNLDQSMKAAYTWSKQGTDFSAFPEWQTKSFRPYLSEAYGAGQGATSQPATQTATTSQPATQQPATQQQIEVASGNVGYTDPNLIQGPILSSAPAVTSTAQQPGGIGTLLSGLTGQSSTDTSGTTSSSGLLSWLNAGRIIKLVIGLILLGASLFLLLAPASSKVAVVAGKAAASEGMIL